jgi:hypothetical protein
MPDDMEDLRGVLLGLGLNALPGLLQNLHKARQAGKNLNEGRSHKDDGPTSQDQAGQGAGAAAQDDPYQVQSMLMPLLQQLNAQGGGQQPLPVNSPGMRPGMPPAPLPRMPGLPRTMTAGASPSGF